MQKFLVNNWLSILSIVIGIVVSYIFYALQKRDALSATAERLRHANGELLDVVESYIINKQRLSEQVIENHISASEREHRVALRPAYTSISLLQDVALRLQKSRHLDKTQKAEYSEQIEALVQAIIECKIPAIIDEGKHELTRTVADLEVILPIENREKIQEIRGVLARLAQRERDLTLRAQEERQRLLAVATALSGITAAMATSLIGSKFLDNLEKSKAISPDIQVAPLIRVLPLMFLVVSVLATYKRLKRRRQIIARMAKSME